MGTSENFIIRTEFRPRNEEEYEIRLCSHLTAQPKKKSQRGIFLGEEVGTPSWFNQRVRDPRYTCKLLLVDEREDRLGKKKKSSIHKNTPHMFCISYCFLSLLVIIVLVTAFINSLS